MLTGVLYGVIVSKDQQVTRTRQQNKPLTFTRTNTERATAQRRLIVEVVVAAPKLPPSAALLLSSLLPTEL